MDHSDPSFHHLRCTFCFVCGYYAEYTSKDVGVSRIGGDSANGYETYHLSCVQTDDDTEVANGTLATLTVETLNSTYVFTINGWTTTVTPTAGGDVIGGKTCGVTLPGHTMAMVRSIVWSEPCSHCNFVHDECDVDSILVGKTFLFETHAPQSVRTSTVIGATVVKSVKAPAVF